MNRQLYHILALLPLLATLASCTWNESLHDPFQSPSPSDKTPIELSVGGVDAPEATQTRTAVITDEVNPLTFSNFDKDSKLFMVMKSEYVSLPAGYTDLNYAGVQTTKYCVTRGEVAADQNSVTFVDANKRYWDDAHARSTKLSIWAFTAPGATYDNCTFGTSDQIQGWKTTAITPTINTWWIYKAAGNGQTADDLVTQNLCFSNNLVDYTSESGTDRRLCFKTPEKKFDGGKLVFYHAMSKITIHIKKGNGYAATEPFAFKTGTTIALTNYNVYGTFDIADGKFSSTTGGNITKISETSKATGDAYTLQALVIPGTTHSTNNASIWNKDNTNTSMSFTINDNLYNISQDALITALRDNSANNGIDANATTVEMEAGKHYIFTFTIGKKQIDNITAQVVNWEEVTAEEFPPSNARIKLQLEERGTAQTSDVAFYKANDNKTTDGIDDNHATYNWKTGYANMNATYSTDHWTTDLFWQSNKDFYHFRALMPDETTVTTDGSGDGDYVTLTSAASYTDVRWGAPMKDDGDNETAGSFKWTYDPETNGFDNAGHTQIYKAIGPTKNAIKLILFHMMSDVTFKVQTSGSSDPDRVDLGNGSTGKQTTIKLEKIHTTGKLFMGNGLVKGSTANVDNSNYTFTATPAPTDGVITWANYGAIPQDLTNVVLVITTPDHNQYKVKLWDADHPITATVTNHNLAIPYEESSVRGKYKINRWYPGFKYTYTFTLKKTGITNIQATIVDWETVEANNETVKIQ